MLNLKTLWFADEAIFMAETALLNRLTTVLGKLVLLLVVFAVLFKTLSRLIKFEGPEKAAFAFWRAFVVGMGGYACLLLFPAMVQFTDDMIAALKKELPGVHENRALAQQGVEEVEEEQAQKSGIITQGFKTLSFFWKKWPYLIAAGPALLTTEFAKVLMEIIRAVVLLFLIPLGPIAILLTLFGMAFPFVAFLENSFKSWFSFYLPVALSTLVIQLVLFAQSTLLATILLEQPGCWAKIFGYVLQLLGYKAVLSSVQIARVLVNGLVSPPDLKPELSGAVSVAKWVKKKIS